MRFMLVMICVGLAFAISTAVEPSWAQTQGGKQTETASSLKPATVPKRQSGNCGRRAMNTSRTSNNCSLCTKAEAKRAEEQLTKVKELLAQGLVTRTRGGNGRRSRGANARESRRGPSAIEERRRTARRSIG